MASLFISHSSRGRRTVERLIQRLNAAGFQSVFIDFDAGHGVLSGSKWESSLYANLRACDAVVFVSTASSTNSEWCFVDLALARSAHEPILDLTFEKEARHPLLTDSQAIDFTAKGDGPWQRLIAGLGAAGLVARADFAMTSGRPVYPGLERFETENAAVFFGRSAEVDTIVGLLRPAVGRAVCIVGASGSGKSSLMRAGALPARIAGHRGPVTAAAFLADGNRVLTASEDGTLRIWEHLSLERWCDLARRRVFRALTSEERIQFGLRPLE